MKKKKNETIEEVCSYREPMVVKEKYAYWSHLYGGYTTFPICPRCGVSFEIEYINYCSSCGQKLKWLGYSRTKVRYAGK